MKAITLLLFIAISCFSGYSQKNLNSTPSLVVEESSLNGDSQSWSIIDGTYQIRVMNNAPKPLLSKELFEFIILSRTENEDVMKEFKGDYILFIPSKTTIQAPEFQKLENIIYTTN